MWPLRHRRTRRFGGILIARCWTAKDDPPYGPFERVRARPAEYVFGNRTHDSADTDGSIEAGER
jgi:hypothetical protein